METHEFVGEAISYGVTRADQASVTTDACYEIAEDERSETQDRNRIAGAAVKDELDAKVANKQQDQGH